MSAVAGTKNQRLALVTGASSGIGQAFARRLAAEGYDLILVGRRTDRLAALGTELEGVKTRTVPADLSTEDGLNEVSALCAAEDIDLLINNAGVSHYMAFSELPKEKAIELLTVKVVAPTMLSRAAVPGMISRGSGTIINVAGMLAFGATAPLGAAAGRATHVGTLAHVVAFSQALHEELRSTGISVQALCPGIVATEFHSRQGMDLSSLPRMSADDVVTASLKGLQLGEMLCAPGIHDPNLLDQAISASMSAFSGQSSALAQRYRF